MGIKKEPRTAKVTNLRSHSPSRSRSHSKLESDKFSTQNAQQTAVKNLSQEKVDEQTGSIYSKFDEVNGWHPWQEAIPGSFITYPVRELSKTKVAYFNFPLAKEMGLIARNHPEELNPELEKKIKETFSLQIINEYDQIHQRRFRNSKIKQHEYMATRYLQLQHADKTGRTSGDGRSIWNGVISHKGTTWDISSRGTGVTALAPGAVNSQEPLKSGNTQGSYQCGMAEIDELFASAILSEVFNNHSINSERVLTIIDLGGGLGIGVRAGKNLMRPAHFFNHLKQGDLNSLSASLDYLIRRQYENGDWKFSNRHPQKYQLLMEAFCDSYAKFAATLDVDYIFAWLDWDGDNVLADAGIIDYGSIRQFGLRYDQYRYDDVERFSTNLNEQKHKAKLIVQGMIQAVDFVIHKNKKPAKAFEDHPILENFNKKFEHYRLERILFRLGFDENNCKYLLRENLDLVEEFAKLYDYIERKKTSDGTVEVSDGVNRMALFNIRNLLRELPKQLKSEKDFHGFSLESESFYKILFAEDIHEKDRGISASMKSKAKEFQQLYKELIVQAKRRRSFARMLEDMQKRSDKINYANRITGNGIVFVVDEILKAREKGVSTKDIQGVIHKFLAKQCLDPDNPFPRKRIQFKQKEKSEKLLDTVLEVVKEHAEDM